MVLEFQTETLPARHMMMKTFDSRLTSKHYRELGPSLWGDSMLRALRFTRAVALLTVALGLSFANNAIAQILTGQVLAGTTPVKHTTVTLFGTGSFLGSNSDAFVPVFQF